MNLKGIKELIEFISNSDLSEVNLKTQELELSIKKYPSTQPVESKQTIPSSPIESPQTYTETDIYKKGFAGTTVPVEKSKHQKIKSEQLITINSPMIGTFYLLPKPEADPFIKIGDIVKKGDVVGIIEAMKLFNEIEAEVEGKVVKILVDNASPVEYDQPLVKIEPL